jgi:osmoprotectant transport system permease protein
VAAIAGAGAVSFLGDVWHWLTASEQWHGSDSIPNLAVRHLQISVAALVVAFLVAAPVAAWLGHRGAGGTLAINIANVGRAIPAYALLVFAVQTLGLRNPTGFGWTRSFVAFVPLVLLGIPPILTNTYVGVREVGSELVDAARGMGLSEREVLRRVELPVALPLVMAGLRIAMIGIIGTASLASFVGVDTLATPIYIGLNVNDNVPIFGGAALVATLALVVDGLLAVLQRAVVSPGLRPAARTRRAFRRPIV